MRGLKYFNRSSCCLPWILLSWLCLPIFRFDSSSLALMILYLSFPLLSKYFESTFNDSAVYVILEGDPVDTVDCNQNKLKSNTILGAILNDLMPSETSSLFFFWSARGTKQWTNGAVVGEIGLQLISRRDWTSAYLGYNRQPPLDTFTPWQIGYCAIIESGSTNY